MSAVELSLLGRFRLFFSYVFCKPVGWLTRLNSFVGNCRLARRGLSDQCSQIEADVIDQRITKDSLNQMIEWIQPDLIHADNLRSILLVADLCLKMALVAMVRDNRFYCESPSAGMRIDGKVYESCAFECLNRYGDSLRKRIETPMAANRELM